MVVDEQLLGTKLLGLLERKTILKDKLPSYFWFQKWQPSNHKELLTFLGLLTISTGLMNMSRHENLLENQRLVVKAHQLLAPAFNKDRLLMLHSMLHFTENERDSSIFCELFRHYWMPQRNVNIDESWISYKEKNTKKERL